MCGIAGFWGPPDPELLHAMTRCVEHRGPDGDGHLSDPAASLGMRRLAIIDIAGGDQPIGSEDGLVQVVYNGEIYNYRELRDELRALGHHFATGSDTEVVVHGYEEWGRDCFARFNGMWGVAVLDRREQAPRLVLARDHFGIKPLHLARAGARLLFASEIKSFFACPDFVAEPEPALAWDYLRHGLHDHVEQGFFRGVTSLEPGCVLEIDAGGERSHRYWTPHLAEDSDPDPAEFRRLFRQSVERRLVAEVPVGTALSGGLDSSSIVCFMAELLREHVRDAQSMGDHLKTFSAVFDGDPIDEQAYIRTVIEATGAESILVHPRSDEFTRELGAMVWHLEEPIVSTGPYAQWCVMRRARQDVTVLLNGQGGDELLAGYVPYQMVYLRELRRRGRWSELLRESWAARDVLWPLIRTRLWESMHRLNTAGLMRARPAGPAPAADQRVQDNLKVRLLSDLRTYSLPSLLRYEDRNSMAFSVESRVPFLDQELVDWILRLPSKALVHAGWSRAILRDGLRGVLPEKIRLRRWKVGFTTPEFRWLKAERAWVRGMLRSPAFASRPYWRGSDVADVFDAICAGRAEENRVIWRALNVEAWHRTFFDGQDARRVVRPERSLESIGDDVAVRMTGPAGEAARRDFEPNPGRHLFLVDAAGGINARGPLRSRRVEPGDSIEAAIREALGERSLQADDLLAISEKAVAVSQGRSIPVTDIRPSGAARWLSRFVTRSPVGIGIAMPETMQLAIEEAGLPRIVAAAAIAACTRPLGLRGMFYRVAGRRVAAIDGPTPYTIPPSNTHAKKAPLNPDGVAIALALALGCRVAIIDANDIGVEVLGASLGVDHEHVSRMFCDNPLGQGEQQTPFAVVRRVGEVADAAAVQ